MLPTTFCQLCSFGSTELRGDGATSDSRSRLRARLAALNALSDTLATERLRLQAEMDSIVYPVLTLPTEITVQIFRHALPPNPGPSPLEAPLLLGQICRQWRDIALNAHDLWQSLSFWNHRSAALLQMWLSRSGNSPLNYSIACKDHDAAGALIDASLQHSHHWEDVTLGLPYTSLSRLVTGRLPMLRRLAIQVHHIMFPNGVRPAYAVPDAVVIDAPLLRAVRIATRTWRINFDLPWSQLTSLVIDLGMRIGECMDLLPKCSALVKLEVYTEPDLSNNSPARTHPHLTLSALESLSVNSKPPSVLQFLTLPRLRVLNLTGDHDHGSPYVLTSLIQRSSCTPQQLTFYLPTTRAQYFPGLLLAVPHSVARLELQLGSSEHVHQLVADLSTPLILPALNTLCIRSSELLPTHLTSLTDMLHARRIAPSSLDSFDVQLNVSVGWKPPPAVLAALQVLVNDGLHIRMELVCRVRSETSTVIESGENGLSWG